MEIKLLTAKTLAKSELAQAGTHYLARSQKTNTGIKFKEIELSAGTNTKLKASELISQAGLNLADTLVLAEWGSDVTSAEFDQILSRKKNYGESLNFLLGNAYGWEREEGIGVKYLSLSKLTMGHELARLILWEQIYRFADRVSGGNYHKE